MKKSLVAIVLSLGIAATANIPNNTVSFGKQSPAVGTVDNRSNPLHANYGFPSDKSIKRDGSIIQTNKPCNSSIYDITTDVYLHSVSRVSVTGKVHQLQRAVANGYTNNTVLAIDDNATNKAPAFFFKFTPNSDTNLVFHVQGRCIMPNCRQYEHLDLLATNLYNCYSNNQDLRITGELKVYRTEKDPRVAENRFLGILNAMSVSFSNSNSVETLTIDPGLHPHVEKW